MRRLTDSVALWLFFTLTTAITPIACSSSSAPVVDAGGDAGHGPNSLDAEAGCGASCPPLPPIEALGTLLLGTPASTSVAVSLITAAPLEVYLEYGKAPGVYDAKTTILTTQPNVSTVFSLTGLSADSAQYYRARFRTAGGVEFASSVENSFHTQRAAGKDFTFTIQADSHRDENSNLALYRLALANIRKDHGDFHVDLGDTFMTEKYAKTNAEVVDRYLEERSYFNLVSDAIPLFLVNGNHEGEQGWVFNGTDNLATWATKARLAYYLNPLPDGFYTGDDTSYPLVGKRGGYYAFHWGDALFVMLDPFWFTKVKPGKNGDGWGWTLGDAQYHWLESTLAKSTAKHKFVFSHHMVGGLADARGGVEAVDLWEWGGKNASGVDEFATKRPGWSKPIHQLLVDAHVTAWFHGHDHLYVKQDVDGIVYQEVPQPSHQGENGVQTAAQWGYTQGKVLSSSGHMRVSVSAAKVTVEYVQAFLPADENPTHKNAQVSDAYTIEAH